MCDEMGIPAKRRKLFTNLYHKVRDNDYGIFHSSYAGGVNQMHVFGRLEQEEFIERDPTFWTDFVDALRESMIEGEVKQMHTPRAHQQEIIDACDAFFAE